MYGLKSQKKTGKLVNAEHFLTIHPNISRICEQERVRGRQIGPYVYRDMPLILEASTNHVIA